MKADLNKLKIDLQIVKEDVQRLRRNGRQEIDLDGDELPEDESFFGPLLQIFTQIRESMVNIPT